MSPTDMRPRDYRHTPKGLMPFIQRSPRRHGRPIRGFVACIGGHPWALAPDAGKGQEQPGALWCCRCSIVVVRPPATEFGRISRRDFRTALPGASGAEFLPFLNSPRRSRAVTVRETHTRRLLPLCRSLRAEIVNGSSRAPSYRRSPRYQPRSATDFFGASDTAGEYGALFDQAPCDPLGSRAALATLVALSRHFFQNLPKMDSGAHAAPPS